MAVKSYAKADDKPQERPDDLDTSRPVAAVYRQSGEKQRGNQSTKNQKINLPAHLTDKGWQGVGVDIVVLDDGKAVSGTLDILDRASMVKLWSLIEANKIGTVAVVKEDRLFRDMHGTEASKFARLCCDHRVKIYVPGKTVYCFHHPVVGDEHLNLFVAQCRAAWDYIKFHIKGQMLANRKDKALEGK